MVVIDVCDGVPAQSRREWREVAGLPSFDELLPPLALALDAERRRGDDAGHVCTAGFAGSSAAPVTVQDYMIRLVKYGRCSPEVFTHVGLYVRRLRLRNGNMCVTSRNVHRVLAAAFVVAVKACDDCYCSNAYYAQVCGVPLQELNQLEKGFLRGVGWELWVTPAERAAFRADLARWAAATPPRRRAPPRAPREADQLGRA